MNTNAIYKCINRALVLSTPLWLALGVCWVFYPGFMSYDTLHALRAARNGVTDSIWPPMVSYVWRGIDFISTNPSAMHFSQVLFLLIAAFGVVYKLTKNTYVASLTIIFYVMDPLMLGTLAVIWKDVLMTTFFLMAILLILVLKDINQKPLKIFIIFILIAILFLGSTTRHNAIFAALPLIIWASYVYFSRFNLAAIVLAVVICALIVLGKGQVDSYSFPAYKKLNNSTGSFLTSVRVLDVAGASICTNQNLFRDLAPDLTVEKIKEIYIPKHINLSNKLFELINHEQINDIWVKGFIDHPFCMLTNKILLSAYLFGWNDGTPFLITHPNIDENEYGYRLVPSKIRDRVVSLIISLSAILIFKAWVLAILCPLFLIVLFLRHRLTIALFAIYLSGLMYALGLVIFGNAADARLLFYSNSIFFLIIMIASLPFISRFLEKCLRIFRPNQVSNPSLGLMSLEHASNTNSSEGLCDIRVRFVGLTNGYIFKAYIKADRSNLLQVNLADNQNMLNFKIITRLLNEGRQFLCLELHNQLGYVESLEIEINIEIRSELALITKQLLLEHKTPLFIEGDIDSSIFPNDKYQAWFDKPDALLYIKQLIDSEKITDKEGELLRDFVVDGYVILEDLIDDEFIDSVNLELNEAIDSGYGGYSYGSSNRIELLHLSKSNIRKLWLDKRHRKFVDLIFGAPSRPCQTLAFVFGSQQDAHQDTIHLTPFPQGFMCGVWIALQDIVPNSGELVVYPGSHREPRLYMNSVGCKKVVNQDWSEFIKKVIPEYERISNKYQQKVYLPKKGSVLIWHENLLHGGSVRLDESLERRAIVIHSFADGCVAYYDSTGNVAGVATRQDLTI